MQPPPPPPSQPLMARLYFKACGESSPDTIAYALSALLVWLLIVWRLVRVIRNPWLWPGFRSSIITFREAASEGSLARPARSLPAETAHSCTSTRQHSHQPTNAINARLDTPRYGCTSCMDVGDGSAAKRSNSVYDHADEEEGAEALRSGDEDDDEKSTLLSAPPLVEQGRRSKWKQQNDAVKGAATRRKDDETWRRIALG